MTDVVTLYTNGLSVRKVAAMLGRGHKSVRLELKRAGIVRSKSEGMMLRYNPAMSLNKGGDLVLTLGKSEKPWAVIVSPYDPVQYFAGPR